MVAAGVEYTLALHSDGTVWAWGDMSWWYSGRGTTPVQMQNLSRVTAVAVGGYHVLRNQEGHAVALREDGTVWTWGDNQSGQPGDEEAIRRSTPEQVQGISAVRAIAAGDRHTVALREDGTVWTWGGKSRGAVG